MAGVVPEAKASAQAGQETMTLELALVIAASFGAM
jgi:hypothetical protein